jgi:signal transduction histidine kinase
VKNTIDVIELRKIISQQAIDLEKEVSRRKSVEHQLNLALQVGQMKHVASVRETTSTLAHALGQPLVVINAYVNGCMQRLQKSSYEIKELIFAMEKVSQHVVLISDIIQKMEKISYQKNKLNYEVVSIKDFIAKMIDLSRGDLNLMPVDIHVETAEKSHHVVMDKILIAKVILTLIRICVDTMNNATTQNKKIVILINELDKNTVVIKIKNNNIHYCDDIDESLFFSRTNTNHGTTEIDLSLCYTIIESHGGTIAGHLAENSQHGCCFQFTLGSQQHEKINHE